MLVGYLTALTAGGLFAGLGWLLLFWRPAANER
jgi:hypothetical protein